MESKLSFTPNMKTGTRCRVWAGVGLAASLVTANVGLGYAAVGNTGPSDEELKAHPGYPFNEDYGTGVVANNDAVLTQGYQPNLTAHILLQNAPANHALIPNERALVPNDHALILEVEKVPPITAAGPVDTVEASALNLGQFFLSIHQEIRDKQAMPLPQEARSYKYLLVKGFLGNHITNYMEDNLKRLRDLGLDADFIEIATEGDRAGNLAKIA